MELADFAGNGQVKESLSDALKSGKLPHALVLQGEPGTGKRTLAKWIARALVCSRRDDAPCGECASCIRAGAGSHPDIRVEEGSGATRSLTVDTVKSMIADAYKMPEEADTQVYLLFIENKMGEAAQNKLLKLIEEPPAHTVFIFTCPSAEALLPTIRSRTQIFTLRPPSLEEAAQTVFRRKMPPVSEEKARELAELCGGNIGRMLEEAESGEAAAARAATEKILPALTAKSGHEILRETAPLIKDKPFCTAVLGQLRGALRQAILLKSGSQELTESERRQALPLQRLSLKRLTELMALTADCAEKMERNANMTLLVTSFCAQARRIAGR